MSTRAKSSSKKSPSLFHRLDVRLPWLKLVTVIIIGVIIILDLLDLTISKLSDLNNHFPTTPMSIHVKATERVLKGKMLVALTFDDGPFPSTTSSLLDILSEKNTLATFFMLGNMASDNPDLVKRIKREGHEIGSHTMYHQNLVRISPADVQSDIDEAKNVFSDILGRSPALTRPPYGNINDTVRDSAGTPLILWSVDTRDWESRDASAIVSTTLDQVHDGAIILMHDIYPTTVDAVPIIVDTLRSQGYEFTTISELAEIRQTSLSSGESYYKFLP